jgi:putative aldouronate transport system permease protein
VVRDRTPGAFAFDILNHILLLLAGFACLVPMIHLVAVSFSATAPAMANLVTIWPIGFNVNNYHWVLRTPQFRTSFMISVMRTIMGTFIVVATTVLAAYPLSIRHGFPGKEMFKWLLIISMLFSGGLIPWYLTLRALHMINTLWALVLPGMVWTWGIIVALNFFRGLPLELSESAEIDGASHWHILLSIYLPLSLPMLATLGLFAAVGHWNAWFDGMILMTDVSKYPLQTYLRTTFDLPSLGFSTQFMHDPDLLKTISDRAVRAANIVLTTIPILVVYPFLQRYFVHGLTLGSLKE